VDAKFLNSRSINLSGTVLFVLLVLGLSGVALTLDFSAGRSLGLGFSLALPLWVCALATAGLGFWAVPLLRALKAGQIIREDGPQAHLKKAGTPTMGGIFLLPPAVFVALLWSNFSADVLAVSALTLAYGAIGFLDDWQIIRRKSNKGISPRMKLGLQIGFAILFCLWLLLTQPVSITTIALPMGLALPLGSLFWVVAGFAMVSESNATNLTDGLDGLAGGTVAIALLGLGAVIAPSHPDLALFAICLSGSCLGFLVHNRNPARVFMGDTGSLGLGGALAAVAVLSNSLFALMILSGLFAWETLSVIIQVTYFKATKGPDGVGKRFFKMSPYHNHLELSGWNETRIVAVFYVIAGLLACVAIAL
jgi:phospho-N-acetylmuramoyl-pentapeptide-transferase